MPSVNALVELIDMPFTVITMTEVNIVNLERVGFNLKNFDMTLVFKVPLPSCSKKFPLACLSQEVTASRDTEHSDDCKTWVLLSD